MISWSPIALILFCPLSGIHFVVRNFIDLRAKNHDINNKDRINLCVDGIKGVNAGIKELKIFDILAVKSKLGKLVLKVIVWS